MDEHPHTDVFREWMTDLIAQFGVEESGQILLAAMTRLEDSDGGTVKEWYAALTAAILERHPDLDEVVERPN